MATKKTVGGYKPETLKKIISDLKRRTNSYVQELKDGRKIKLVISAGNRKIGRAMNVSLAPIITCGNCKDCMFFCYDVKACLQYENVRNARAKNTALFMLDRFEFFRQLWEAMSKRRTNKFLRFHVSGEIMDYNHFELIVETARRFPDFVVWTYTKMYHIVNEWIKNHGGNKDAVPKNLIVMFSEWHGIPIPNTYGLPEFSCAFPGEQGRGFHCPGNCDFCKEHNCGCVGGQSSYADLH